MSEREKWEEKKKTRNQLKLFSTQIFCNNDHMCHWFMRYAISYRFISTRYLYTRISITWKKNENRQSLCCVLLWNEWQKGVLISNSLCLVLLLFRFFPPSLVLVLFSSFSFFLSLSLWAINFGFCSLNVTRSCFRFFRTLRFIPINM